MIALVIVYPLVWVFIKWPLYIISLSSCKRFIHVYETDDDRMKMTLQSYRISNYDVQDKGLHLNRGSRNLPQ